MDAHKPIRLKFPELLRDLARAWRVELDRHIRPEGLSLAQYSVLTTVRAYGDGMVQREIAQAMGIEGATLVRLLDRLAEAGLVQRRDLAHDRRYKSVHLTAEGQAALERSDEILHSVRQELLSGVDDGDLMICMRVFERLLASLSELERRP